MISHGQRVFVEFGARSFYATVERFTSGDEVIVRGADGARYVVERKRLSADQVVVPQQEPVAVVVKELSRAAETKPGDTALAGGSDGSED